MKKKILSVILVLAMLACMIPLGTVVSFAATTDCPDCGGSGKIHTDCPYCEDGAFYEPCWNCDGTGFDHCDRCQTSGLCTYCWGRVGGCEECDYTGKCPECGGTGYYTTVCSECNGAKKLFSDYCYDCDGVGYTVSDCTTCGGKGKVISHTHTKGTEYMSDGRAHWLKCDDADCPLNKADDPVLAYEIAFSSYEGPELKETLDYSEKCGTYSEEKTSMYMGRQGLVTDDAVGRTIIGLTEKQLGEIGSKLVIVGCDDSDDNKQISVDVSYAYTYFYNWNEEKGEAEKINAEDMGYAAFVIIDSALVKDTITGFGYYRVYNDIVSDDNLIGEALFAAPRTFKAVYAENGDKSLNFYYDTLDHAGEGTLYDNLPAEAKSASSWGYNAIRTSVKGANINQNVIKYKGLKSTNNMFYNMTAAESFSGAEYLDVTGVTDMKSMFKSYGKSTANAANLEDVPDVSRWNTAKVTDMSSLFQGYGQFSAVTKAPDVSHWNTANVTNMLYVFNGYVNASTKIASSLSETPDVSNWNTAKVTDMEGVFANYGAYSTVLNFTLDLSKWDISQVKGTGTHNLVASAGLNAETWEVIIPAKSGEKSNDAKHWYTINAENEESSIEPDNKRSFTLAQ